MKDLILGVTVQRNIDIFLKDLDVLQSLSLCRRITRAQPLPSGSDAASSLARAPWPWAQKMLITSQQQTWKPGKVGTWVGTQRLPALC